jgi:hypothetical protein
VRFVRLVHQGVGVEKRRSLKDSLQDGHVVDARLAYTAAGRWSRMMMMMVVVLMMLLHLIHFLDFVFQRRAR